MARSAKLTSIDAVRDMAAALGIFAEETNAALDDLDINVRRAVEWIEQDRKKYWEAAVRRGWERVGEARAELEKALTYRKVADHRPSCREERAALEKAKRQVQHAEEIYRVIPELTHRIEHAVREVIGAKTLLVDWLSGDLPRANGALKRMAASLDAYATSTQKSRGTSTAATSQAGDEAAESDEGQGEPGDEDSGSPRSGDETPPDASDQDAGEGKP